MLGRGGHFNSAFSICNTSGHSKRPTNSENDLKMTGGIQLKEGDEFGVVDSAGLLFHVDKKMRLDDEDIIHNDYGAIISRRQHNGLMLVLIGTTYTHRPRRIYSNISYIINH